MRWTLHLQRSAWLPLCSLLLLLVSHARLTGSLPTFEVWLYGACFALLFSLVLSLVWLPIAWLDGLGRGRSAALLSALLSFPFVHALGRHLADGDGLRAQGLSPLLLEMGFTAALLAVPLTVWALQRRLAAWGVRRTAGAFFALLVGLALVTERRQAELAALFQASAVFTLAALLAEALKARIAHVGLALVAAFGLLGLGMPARLAEGRRVARVQESSLDYLDGRLWQRSFRDHAAPMPSAAECAARLTPPSWAPLPLPRAQRRNVVLLSIDSVRADFATKQFAGRTVMPELARFAGESSVPARAMATYPATALSMRSALTGLLPSELIVSAVPAFTLFERVRDRLEVHAVLPRGNYFQRPDVVQNLLRGARVTLSHGAEAQTDAAIAQLRALRSADRPHLVWVHFFEPHEPYVQRAGFDFGHSDEQRYASELAYADHQLGRLLSVLRDEGWYEDSLIIVFSDHGEAFGEHGHQHHHSLLYPALTEVPFALHAPLPLPDTDSVQLTDIAPSVLHFLGFEPGEHSGRSLFQPGSARFWYGEAFPLSGSVSLAFARAQAASDAQLTERLLAIELGFGYPSKLSVSDATHTLIWHRATGASELYARADYGALHDLAAQLPNERSRLEAQAARFRAQLLVRGRCQLQAGQAGPARQ